MDNRNMEHRDQKIPDKDVYYFEFILMIKNHEEFIADVDDEETATRLYEYITQNYYETGVTELD